MSASNPARGLDCPTFMPRFSKLTSPKSHLLTQCCTCLTHLTLTDANHLFPGNRLAVGANDRLVPNPILRRFSRISPVLMKCFGEVVFGRVTVHKKDR